MLLAGHAGDESPLPGEAWHQSISRLDLRRGSGFRARFYSGIRVQDFEFRA